MQLSAALRERDREDFDRVELAIRNPKRGAFNDPLDARLECRLGRLRVANKISEAEYRAGVKWREIYSDWLASIQNSDGISEEHCEAIQAKYLRGIAILEARDDSKSYKKRKRVLHAVNAICVFDEPEELGDAEFTLAAAKVGLADLSVAF